MSEPIKKSEVKTVPFDPVEFVAFLVEQGKVADSEIERAKELMYLGILCCERGHYLNAESSFEESLKIFRSIPGTELEQATCAMNLAIVYQRTGRFCEAENAFQDALTILRAIPGTELRQAGCLANMASYHKARGQASQAGLCAEEALAACNSLPPEATAEITSICYGVLEGIRVA